MNNPQSNPEEIHRVSFIGLGVMGYPMAGHLIRYGYEVRVYSATTKFSAAEFPFLPVTTSNSSF